MMMLTSFSAFASLYDSLYNSQVLHSQTTTNDSESHFIVEFFSFVFTEFKLKALEDQLEAEVTRVIENK